ncbi:hypothetical protein JZ751_026014 [Albula glossodonta]|uniref:Uncharacterized protein n=1 Tax=Albula glossodonta TaxID=121402 RepID=A0A8T2MXR0_9TELE|nr:hypothetical protein JZ751_026014 [Albula glossodonta]
MGKSLKQTKERQYGGDTAVHTDLIPQPPLTAVEKTLTLPSLLCPALRPHGLSPGIASVAADTGRNRQRGSDQRMAMTFPLANVMVNRLEAGHNKFSLLIGLLVVAGVWWPGGRGWLLTGAAGMAFPPRSTDGRSSLGHPDYLFEMSRDFGGKWPSVRPLRCQQPMRTAAGCYTFIRGEIRTSTVGSLNQRSGSLSTHTDSKFQTLQASKSRNVSCSPEERTVRDLGHHTNHSPEHLSYTWSDSASSTLSLKGEEREGERGGEDTTSFPDATERAPMSPCSHAF